MDRGSAGEPEGDLLPSVLWTHHQLGERKLVRGRWRLQRKQGDGVSLTPWPLLSRAQGWAFCWRSREVGADLWIGWDALLTLSLEEVQRLQDKEHQHFIFGGRPFFDEETSEIWGELGSSQWLLPATLLRLNSSTCDLYLCAEEGAEAELLEKARQVLKGLSRPEIPEGSLPSLPLCERRFDIPSKDRWIDGIEEALASIQDEKLAKVVMSRCVRLDFAMNISWTQWIQRLLETKEEAFVFGLKSPSGRVFMGRSPERLLAWDKDGFELDAIAGTRARTGALQEDRAAARELQNSPKEKREHRLVRNSIAEVLSEEGLSSSTCEEEQLLSLEHVQHMRSRFSGRWSAVGEAKGFSLLKRLHPTPAVGGVPRPAALDFLRQHEAFERGWFAGFIGFIAGTSAEFAIGIRSALWFQRQLHVFAGAGIVEASVPQAEWQETEQKMQNFLGLLSSQPLAEGCKVRDAAAESF